MQELDIQICNNADEAPHYKDGLRGGEGFKGAKLMKAVVVRQGTQGGRAIVDLQFEDEQGNKYVAMITARLLKTVTDIAIPNAND